MRYFVTGGAGFIGSHAVDHLLRDGHQVTAYDNLSTGFSAFLEEARAFPSFQLVRGDLLDRTATTAAMEGHDMVFHLAANADVRHGLEHPEKDLEHNTLATFNVLEAMRTHGIRRIAFTSTASIYGEPTVFPTPEDCPFPLQTSLYGASKLACEGMISSYCEGFGFQAWIFRLVSIAGERYSHGHVFDFYKKLLHDPERLEVLGNGTQRKSYLFVGDCIAAMLLAIARSQEKVQVFNVGSTEYCTVKESVEWITSHLGLHPTVSYTGGDRGWIGDSPFIFLDCRKLHALGWRPSLTIRESVLRTLAYLQSHHWLLERH